MTGPPGRRQVLKGLGLGSLAAYGLTGTAAAQESTTELDVTVTPGQGPEDDWTQVAYVDSGESFSAKVQVSGIEPHTETSLAYMIAPGGPDGGFVSNEEVQSSKLVEESEGPQTSFIHYNWTPEKFLTSWPSGIYKLYATVVDRNQEVAGFGISPPFEVDT